MIVRRRQRYRLEPGESVTPNYRVVSHLGTGWESEVYKIREERTDVVRAAKIFYPERNVGDRTAVFHAKKLHALRSCPVVIKYVGRERAEVRGAEVTVLISEFVEGEILNLFLRRQPKGRLPPFQAMHLLYALAKGMEDVHRAGEYHGDLHMGNVIVQRHGLGFDLKLLDLYKWKGPRTENMREDLFDLIRIFYDALGGQPAYAKQPPEVKQICRGLKRSLIRQRFPRTTELIKHLETMEWGP